MRIEEDFHIDGPPQLESEVFTPIRALMEDCPKWHESYALELTTVCRNNPVVRSAIMFALELARPAELQLRTANTIEEVKQLQGQVKGLEAYANNLITQMEATEIKEPTNEDQE